MAYKIKKLVDEGFDFDTIYPEKQDEIRAATKLSFKLSEIVDFVRKQTNDFRDEFPLAIDLDNAIYKLYERQFPTPEKVEVPQVGGQPMAGGAPQKKAQTKEDIEKQIKILNLLLKRVKGEDAEKAKKKISILEKLMKIKFK